jgi:hemerythrin-like metal-binding protein
MMFDWQPEYSVDLSEIDSLHQEIFRKASDLHAAVLAGRPRDTLAELLAGLVKHTQAHFAIEESLMLASQYPGYPRHKARHEALSDKLLGYRPDDVVSLEAMQSLKDWVVQHIGEEDRELGRYLARGTGAGPTPNPL